jgi:hypothetical protein
VYATLLSISIASRSTLMKLKLLTLCILASILTVPFLLSAQYLGEKFKMEDIRSIVLEDFENNSKNWKVSASRFTTEGYPQMKFNVEGVPIALTGSYAEGENKYVAGIRGSFTRKGYNRINIYPEQEIVVPGHAKKIDVWVWGANYYYTLEAHLRDYRGIVYRIPLGSLHFMGWRNLSTVIPTQIPQYVRYLPMEKPLTFVRFVIWTEPTERVDDYIIYLDHFKVMTDVYRERFDGDRLADNWKEIWTEPGGAGSKEPNKKGE